MTRAEAHHQLALLLRDNTESPCACIMLFNGDRQALAIALDALRDMDEVDAEARRAETPQEPLQPPNPIPNIGADLKTPPEAKFNRKTNTTEQRKDNEMKTDTLPDWHLHAVAELEADKTRVFRLLANIRAAAGDPEGKLMQDELVAHIAQLFGNSERLAKVEAENAALREDKERLDWIENAICGEGLSLYHALDAYWDNAKNPTLRQAIKAAIDAAKGGAK